MNNPFNLKKEIPKTPFEKATMIMLKDRGKGSHKKFLFDHNASEALNLTEESELGFIIDGENVFMADIKDLDKEKWSLSKEDYNKIHKSQITKEFDSGSFKFNHFNNAKLYDLLEQELELPRDSNNKFTLTLIKEDWEQVMNNTLADMLKRMKLDTLYYLSPNGETFFKGEVPKYRTGRSRRPTSLDHLEDYLAATNKATYNGYITSKPYPFDNPGVVTKADEENDEIKEEL